MRQNDRKPWEQFTVCICDKCGEAYEPDREHVCRKKNSYPGAETDKSNIDRILAFKPLPTSKTIQFMKSTRRA